MVPQHFAKCDLRYPSWCDDHLTFVRFQSRFMVGYHEDNTYLFLRFEWKFVGEFSDAFEVEVVGRRHRDLKEDCDVLGDINRVNGFCG